MSHANVCLCFLALSAVAECRRIVLPVNSSRSEQAASAWATPPIVAVAASSVTQKKEAQTFQEFYLAHETGRGIWKWANALDAYQRHFVGMVGLPVALAEVGVQSGGSIDMWHSVLGEKCHVYGLDINPQANKFATPTTSITIGDQADVNMWAGFFSTTVKSDHPLDVLIDDGGHEPNQMLVTLQQSFPRMNPGGFVAIEDIHGQHYIQSFFTPAASYIATQADQNLVDSVHVYPYLLMVQRAGKAPEIPKPELTFSGSSVTVDSFEGMWAALPSHSGGHVILENAGWGPFLTGQGLTNFFATFADLHAYTVHDEPTGCAKTAAAVCTNFITSSPQQAQITGIHVYPTRLVVEVAGSTVKIEAVRRGSDWLSYR